MSGVKLTNECLNTYSDIQQGRKHRYAIFKILNGEIVLDKVGDRANSYEDYLGDLQQKDGNADDCRYAVYDYEYTITPEGAEATNKNKLFLMLWCPDTAMIKKKMIYSSSFDTLKKAFNGVHKVIQANGHDEAEQAHVLSILKATDRT